MPFRIDSVSEMTGGWSWRVKGIRGQGIYGTLATGKGGRGLYQVEMGNMRPLIVPDLFYVPSGLPKGEAKILLSLALERLDWGPEVNQEGDIT